MKKNVPRSISNLTYSFNSATLPIILSRTIWGTVLTYLNALNKNVLHY